MDGITNFHWLFVSPATLRYVVLPDHAATFEAQQELKDRGFQLVWDSAPDRPTAIMYAANVGSYHASALYFTNFCWIKGRCVA